MGALPGGKDLTMPHYPHKTTLRPTVADKTPVDRIAGIERHLGTTRAPRPRALKPPIG